jgi:hypothetical protein
LPIRPHFSPDQRKAARQAVLAGITKRRHLNPPRRHRTYPRVIKRAWANKYRVKKPGDAGTRHTGPPTIKLVRSTPARST